MKKATENIINKTILCCILLIGLLLISMSITAFADTATMEITLRIEGIENNFFFETLTIPFENQLTVQDAVLFADANSDELTIIGASGDNPYITDINGDSSGKFGGWDGWLYTINGTEAATGMQDAILKDGDSILLYYGDPYGIGMQYPQVDTSKLADGIIRFFSMDTTYDSDWNPVITENPVSDMKVIFDSSAYTTDKNGIINLSSKDLSLGSHTLFIEKKAANGAPLVLRLEPDFSVTITEINATTPPSNEKTENPNTSEDIFTSLPIIFATVAVIFVTKRRFA